MSLHRACCCGAGPLLTAWDGNASIEGVIMYDDTGSGLTARWTKNTGTTYWAGYDLDDGAGIAPTTFNNAGTPNTLAYDPVSGSTDWTDTTEPTIGFFPSATAVRGGSVRMVYQTQGTGASATANMTKWTTSATPDWTYDDSGAGQPAHSGAEEVDGVRILSDGSALWLHAWRKNASADQTIAVTKVSNAGAFVSRTVLALPDDPISDLASAVVVHVGHNNLQACGTADNSDLFFAYYPVSNGGLNVFYRIARYTTAGVRVFDRNITAERPAGGFPVVDHRNGLIYMGTGGGGAATNNVNVWDLSDGTRQSGLDFRVGNDSGAAPFVTAIAAANNGHVYFATDDDDDGNNIHRYKSDGTKVWSDDIGGIYPPSSNLSHLFADPLG